MKFDIQKLITKHTDGDNVDYVKINEELDTQNKNIVAKEVNKESKKFDKDTVIKEFLMDNEFKSLDDFNAFKKNGATADTEAVKRVEKLLEASELKLKELIPLQGEVQAFKNRALLRTKGITDQDQLEFMEYKISKLDGESFEEKVTTYSEANPESFTQTPPPKNIITTGSKVGTKIGTNEKLGWEKILEDKYGDLDK